MFDYVVFVGLVILSGIIADPNQAPNAGNIYVPPPPPAYNYYGYRQAQSQQQLQTPSPYLNKRNPNNDAYSNSQQSHSSIASSYGTASTRSSANQCKLHINCPSKKINYIHIRLFKYYFKVQEIELHLIFKDQLVHISQKSNKIEMKFLLFRTTWPARKTRHARSKWSPRFTWTTG